MAEITGVPFASVFHHDQNLVAAKLRKPNARGRGGVVQTANDAVDLLIPVIASTTVKDTAQAFRAYRKLPLAREVSSKDRSRLVSEVANLADDHTFLDLFRALLSAATSGSLQDWMPRNEAAEKINLIMFHYNAIRVVFRGPIPMIDVTMSVGEPTTGISEVHLRYADSVDPKLSFDEMRVWAEKQAKKNGKIGDLEEARAISARTIIGIGEMLRS